MDLGRSLVRDAGGDPLGAGLAAGVLFAGEFVFIYLTPALTALGLHFFVRGERLAPRQWLGVLVAVGIVLVNLRR